MPVVTGGGGVTGTRAQQIAQYAAMLNAAAPPSPGSTNLGDDYTAYMNAHPTLSPETVYDQVAADIEGLISGGGLTTEFSGALGDFLTSAAKGVSQEATGAAKSLPSISNPLDWLASLGAIADDIGKAGAWFGSKSNWIRITKVSLGVILIISGVTHLTRGESAVVNTVGKVAGAAALT